MPIAGATPPALGCHPTQSGLLCRTELSLTIRCQSRLQSLSMVALQVRQEGVEPSILAALVSKTSVYTVPPPPVHTQ